MPNVCPEGSEPKVGADSGFYLGPALIEATFPAISPWMGHLIPVLGNTWVNTSDLCATSPDDEEEFSIEEVALATVTPGGMALLAAKLYRLTMRGVWNTYCQCLPTSAPGWSGFYDATECALPDTGADWPASTTVPEWRGYVTLTSDDAAGKGGWTSVGGWRNGVLVAAWGGRVAGYEGRKHLGNYAGEVDMWRVWHVAGDGGWTACTRIEIEQQTPSGIVVVPPEPDAPARPTGLPDSPDNSFGCTTIEDICRLLSYSLPVQSGIGTWVAETRDTVEDLHDLAPPRTLTPQETIPAQEGDVETEVANVRAIVVTCTTIPTFKGWEWAEPKTYADLGVVRLGTVDGWLTDVPIQHADTVIIDVAPTVTRIGLSLAPGVVATLKTFEKES